MVDRSVLSEEEIDALLTGVNSGDVETDEDEAQELDAQGYDLASETPVVHGRLPTLELIGEKFAREVRAKLQHELRFPIDVGAGGVRIMKFSEFSESLTVPTSLTLCQVNPFKGEGVVAFDAQLISRVVDHLFGGGGSEELREQRDFSPTEYRIIAKLLGLVSSAYEDAWQDVIKIQLQPLRAEVNPSLLNHYGEAEVLMVGSFVLELPSGNGEIHIVLPYEALEPFRHLLDCPGRFEEVTQDSTFRPRLEKCLLEADVGLNCEVASKEVPLRELLRLQVGDVLDVDVPELHVVEAAHTAIWQGKLVESRGNLALEYAAELSE